MPDPNTPEAPRKRGRPPGSKNKAVPSTPPREEAPEAPASSVGGGTTKVTLEADRDRLLRGIDECKAVADPVTGRIVTDWKTVAALQSQLNGVNRMLLRITGETAPTDANLIRSPQYLRLKTDLLAVLKKHPAALADVAAVFDTAER